MSERKNFLVLTGDLLMQNLEMFLEVIYIILMKKEQRMRNAAYIIYAINFESKKIKRLLKENI